MVEDKISKLIKEDRQQGVSKVAERFNNGNFIDGMEFNNEYEKKNFIEELAKAKEIVKTNKENLEKFIDGELRLPDEANISETALAYAIFDYAVKNNPSLIKKAFDYLKDVSVSAGQNVAFINQVYQTFENTDKLAYYLDQAQKMKNNKIIKQAKKWGFMKKTETIIETKVIEKIKKQIVKQKSKEAKYKDLKENLNTKIQDLDNFLKELKC